MTKKTAYIIIPILMAISLTLEFCKVDDSREKAEANADTSVPRLIWQDEFEEEGMPDTQKWSYDVGDACDLPCGCGWGNGELQYYTDARRQNARVEDGFLVIETRKESWLNSSYTSARLVSKGKRDMLYGRIEVRAKLPSGIWTWPAIWMLSSDDKYGDWPKSGEIDIMEHYGHKPGIVHGTAHTKSFNHMDDTEQNGRINIPDIGDEFHIYSMEWEVDKLKWYVDGQLYHTFDRMNEDPDNWPYDHPFYLIMNLAVRGDVGLADMDDSIWPQQLLIDYVRIYKI